MIYPRVKTEGNATDVLSMYSPLHLIVILKEECKDPFTEYGSIAKLGRKDNYGINSLITGQVILARKLEIFWHTHMENSFAFLKPCCGSFFMQTQGNYQKMEDKQIADTIPGEIHVNT